MVFWFRPAHRLVETMTSHSHLGFRVAYDGASFSGFQSQRHDKSVQDELEAAFKRVLKFEGRIHFSSRTDAGVHAVDQWIMVPDGYELWKAMPLQKKKRLRLSLNSLMKDRVSLWAAYCVPDDLRLSKAVVGKEYHYRVVNGVASLPLMRHQAWHLRSPLSLERMKSELQFCLGRHNFKGFSNTSKGSMNERNVFKTMWTADICEELHPFTTALGKEGGHRIFRLRFSADGFLYHMVRNIVGTIIEIGLGKDFSVAKILASRDRRVAGIKAPAHGLTLAKTFVNDDVLSPLPYFNDVNID